MVATNFSLMPNLDAISIIRKVENNSKPLSDFADVQRGVTPFRLTDKPMFPTSKRAFKGTVRRYSFEEGPQLYVRFDETLAEFKPEKYFVGSRLLMRELISRQFQLQAVKVEDDFVTKLLYQLLQSRRKSAARQNGRAGRVHARTAQTAALRENAARERDAGAADQVHG